MVRASTGYEPASANPLTRRLVDALRALWCGGGAWADLADALVDELADHIRRAGIAGPMDPRLADAIADAIRDHATRDDHQPHDAPRADARSPQLTLDDALRGEVDPGERIVAHRFADGSLAVRPIGGAR